MVVTVKFGGDKVKGAPFDVSAVLVLVAAGFVTVTVSVPGGGSVTP
jgi:hypothetical protein